MPQNELQTYSELASLERPIKEMISEMRESNWASLSADRRAFAMAYLRSYSHVQAARDIGRPGKGLVYMRDPQTSAFISDLQEQFEAINLVTDQWVRNKWIEVLPKLMGEEEIMAVTPHGEEVAIKKFHSSETVAALRELGKSTKFYAEGSGNSGEGGVNVTINLGSMVSEPPVVEVKGDVIEH